MSTIKRMLSTILLILLVWHVHSHDLLECASRYSDEDAQAVRQLSHYQRSVQPAQTRDTSKPTRYGLVQTYILKNSNGASSITATNAALQIATANKLYLSMNYKWIMDTPIVIESDEFFNYNQLWVQDSVLKNTYNRPDAFNTYWFNNLCTASSGCYCGYAFYPWSGLRQTAFLDGHCLGNVFAHEIGHNLGLLHTFESPKELVDETNCATAGDLVCDTPADPNVQGQVDESTCTWKGSALDPNGQKYNPPVHNIMSYTVDSCRSEFTAGQYERIESFHEQITAAFVDYQIVIANATVDNYNTVSLNVTSSHGFLAWNAKLNGVIVGGTAPSSLWTGFTYTFDSLPNSNYELLVRVCYPYTWPEDGTQFCLEKSQLLPLTGSMFTLATTESTGTQNDGWPVNPLPTQSASSTADSVVASKLEHSSTTTASPFVVLSLVLVVLNSL